MRKGWQATGHDTGETKKRKFPLSIVVAALNLLVLAIIAISEDDLPDALSYIARLKPGWGAAAFGAMAAYLLLEGLVFYRALRRCGVRLSYGSSLKCMLVGRFYTLATPLGIAGQPSIVAMGVREGAAAAQVGAAASVRYVGYQMGYMALTGLCLILYGDTLSKGIKWGLVTGLLFNLGLPTLLLTFLRKPEAAKWLARTLGRLIGKLKFIKNADELGEKLLGTVDDFSDGVKRAGVRGFVEVALFGLPQAACAGLIIPLINRAFGGTVDFAQLWAQAVILSVAISAMPTPGNTGAAEGGFYAFFNRQFRPFAFPAMLMWRVIQCYMPLIIGALAMFWKPRRRR